MGVPTYLSSEKLPLRVGVPTYLYWTLTPYCLPTVHLNRTLEVLFVQNIEIKYVVRPRLRRHFVSNLNE